MRGCEVTVHFFLQREAIILSVAGAIISLNSQSFLVRQLYYRLASLTGCRLPHGFQQGQRLGQPVTLLLFFSLFTLPIVIKQWEGLCGPKNKTVSTTGRTAFWHKIFPLSTKMWGKEKSNKKMFMWCYFQVLLLNMHENSCLSGTDLM